MVDNSQNCCYCLLFLFEKRAVVMGVCNTLFSYAVFLLPSDRGNDYQRPYRGGFNDRRGGGGGGGYYNRDRDSGYSGRGK
jgi:hypothetical protein